MKKSISIKTLIIIALVLILIAICLYIFFIRFDSNEKLNIIENIIEKQDEPKQVTIYTGNQRPVAVMIDNNKNAWPQASINQAYVVYEIIVEGGETRLMALFKNVDIDFVGPTRSARHYFLDYALENDAIYVHFGWSPQAQNDIRKLDVDNINGLYYDSMKARTEEASFWRDKKRSSPHNAFASLSKIYEIAEEQKYRITSEETSVLKYSAEEINLESDMIANTVTIPYSKYTTVKFVYDEQSKRYTKYSKGEKQTDAVTGEDITARNIIITFAKNYTLTDSENKGRQGLSNIGTLDGFYITNGKAIPIKCVKNSRAEKTVYQDLEGNEISVNDGNTFIQICPIDANVTIN